MRLPCPPNACPMDKLIRLVSGPWTSYLVFVLGERGAQRFGTLKRQVAGISTRLLTERLRRLEAVGLVARTVRPTVPPEVSYALTERGRELGAALRALDEVARRWQAEDRRAFSEEMDTGSSKENATSQDAGAVSRSPEIGSRSTPTDMPG
jgi:DNA-binding HxlR family transcriptional regulator